MKVLVLLILFGGFGVQAAETVSGAGGASVVSGNSNFSSELKCGTALLGSDLVAVRAFHGVQGKGLVLSGVREGKRGFYSYGGGGAAFSELGGVAPARQNYAAKTFELKLAVPGLKEKTSVVYKQKLDGGGEAGFELKSTGTLDVATELASVPSNDSLAQRELTDRFRASIASIVANAPWQGSMMFPNLVRQKREEVRAKLSKVFCACQGVEEVQEEFAKVRASKELKAFEGRYECE